MVIKKMLDELEKSEEPVNEADFIDQVTPLETYERKFVSGEDDVDNNSIKTCTTNSSTQTTMSVGGSEEGLGPLIVLLIAMLIAFGFVGGIFGVDNKPLQEAMLECQENFGSEDGQMNLKDQITIAGSGSTYTSKMKTMSESFQTIFEGDNKPVFFYGKPGMPIRYILEALYENKFKQTDKVFWLINIRDSFLRRFDCYKHRAEEFVKEEQKELYLVFADMFQLSKEEKWVKDSLRIILKDWVLNIEEPAWKNIFYESSFKGTKTFMEQLVNAGAIVLRQDKSIRMRTDNKDQKIGEGPNAVIVTGEGAFIDGKGSPIPRFEKPETWLDKGDMIMLKQIVKDKEVINEISSSSSRSSDLEEILLVHSEVAILKHTYWLGLKRKNGNRVIRVSDKMVVKTADHEITFVCSLPTAAVYKDLLLDSLKRWKDSEKIKFLKDRYGKENLQAHEKLMAVYDKVSNVLVNDRSDILYLGDQALQMVEDVDSDPNMEKLLNWLEKLLADDTEKDKQRVADINEELRYIENIKTGECG